MTHPLAPLAAYRQFIVVKLIPLPSGKTDKIPVSPLGEVGVDAHAPANWQSWVEADAVARAWGPQYTVGFVLTRNDPFWCLDIDDCRLPDGAWSPLALQICAALPGAVVELSQSGRGLHLWLQHAEHFEHSKKNVPLGIELYSEARFIALGSGHTGALAPDCPAIRDVAAKLFPPRLASGAELPDEGPCAEWLGPTDDDELIRRALASTSSAGVFGGKATFADLWNGNADALARSYPSADGGYDASSADAALAQHLAFWTGKDAARIERLMRRSALVRAKWDDRDDYLGPRTILGACGQCRQVYRDPRRVAATQQQQNSGSEIAAVAEPNRSALSFVDAAGGAIAATLPNVCSSFRAAKLLIALDRFTGRQMIGKDELPLRELTDEDAIRLRHDFEQRGFKPIKADIMRDALRLEAIENAFDSAQNWAESLSWDGDPRIERFLHSYLGAADTAYTRAVGAFWLTALAGRALQPGCQVDMVPVLAGRQGAGKSSALRALCPSPEYFGSLDLAQRDADLCRMMSGKLVIELSELAGLRTKEREAIKAIITRRDDEWVAKYQERSKKHPRRFVFAATTNENEFLDDPSGERRWLPFTVGAVDVAAIARDREQLWAEGVARFKRHGVEWQSANDLARAEHEHFAIVDEWAVPVAAFLAATPGPIYAAAIFEAVLKRPMTGAPQSDTRRMANVLRSLGYARRSQRGVPGKPWVFVGK